MTTHAEEAERLLEEARLPDWNGTGHPPVYEDTGETRATLQAAQVEATLALVEATTTDAVLRDALLALYRAMYEADTSWWKHVPSPVVTAYADVQRLLP